MITKSLYVKNIVKLTQIFKKIVLGVWGEVKMGVVLKKRVVS
jgi:DNA anti-recombination protein RmuC